MRRSCHNVWRTGEGRTCAETGVREQGAGVAHAMIQPDNAPSILLYKKLGFFMDRREVALMDLNDPNLKL